ncbi:LysR family transcriptional regulator [Ensifer adhaerens]|uniref:LysR family transcriptional regulator n=1 Tax=Ensifer adhaerens TaxID=106592 RepID=UPI001CC0B828|nr:LysR family transcriptional regulator [Ensifer adhaerens]MBZ7925642.1 LysR family transcriptional regulator [Ensifer adhaerens]UAX95214.1 LysR family transcriptional regulator [Ensifer adhaerens]UAY02895.1 LysR family transcriptional regulator [Ensifer adhaerens]UAY10879.1 LysR family transcriptional regulator [Ensifer adhaerens]
MDFTTLEIFLLVAERTSVTRAAAEIGRAPSNVTNRIRALEEELGACLFNRDAKKMTLTREGRVFRSYASRLVALADEARNALKPTAMPDILRLGSMESTAASRLPPVLQTINRAHPSLALRLTMGSTEELTRAVVAEEIDCALIARLPGDIAIPGSDFLKELDSDPIYREDVLIVLPASHPPIKTALDVRVNWLAALEPGCTYRRVAEQWARSSTTIATKEVSSYHAILASVAAGDAIGVVPRSVFELMDWPGAAQIHSLSEIQTLLVYRKEAPSPAIDILRRALLADAGVH